MKEEYKPWEIESHWQKAWEQAGIYKPDIQKASKPFYNLMMFPYPSAEGLHAGNMYAFTGADIYGRFTRMKGFDVFEPIGLDGFGIHSENYAIKIGKHPVEQAKTSEGKFYEQLHAIGNSYDWDKKLETYDPKYYKWTQWIFIQMFKHGLAYRKKAQVNFCPSCKTVLSDEQVIAGVCERCSSAVEKKELKQWFFRITRYADKLLENLDKINWSEKVKIAQRNWLGKKEWIDITYPIDGTDENIVVSTTRPDTNFGATFIVVAPENDIVRWLLSSKLRAKSEELDEIRNYVEKAKGKSELERISEGRKKTGVFSGLYAINPLNNKKLPVWIADFVLTTVGTGAVVGVPGHDIRDFEFAKQFNLPIIRVVVGKDGDTSEIKDRSQVQEDEGVMINSEFLNGIEIHEAIKKMMDYLEEKGLGKRAVRFHLRDWLISRQRYWGPPIPMMYCESCAREEKGERKEMPGWYTVSEKDLPVKLPYIENYRPEGTGESPLAQDKEWINVKCPACGSQARRETDVSDTFLDSSWYFLRYPSVGAADASENPINKKITEKWLPVNMYIGGAEHSVLHLLYSRFVTMALHDLGYLKFNEPFTRFYAHGLLIKEGAKMSKSKGNIVMPDEYIKKFGADTMRCYLMFLGPFNQGGDFYDTGIEGMSRFLRRVWTLIVHKTKVVEKEDDEGVLRDINRTIKGVTEDIERLSYNTAIAKLMEFYNIASTKTSLGKDSTSSFLKLLAPFAPHITEELWKKIGEKFSIHKQSWPLVDEKYLEQEEVIIVVQINGKVRDTSKVKSSKFSPRFGEAGKVQNEIEKLVKESEKVKMYLKGKEVRKVIYVEGKVINFVTE